MNAEQNLAAPHLRVVASNSRVSRLEEHVRINRPLVYARIMAILGDRIRAAHQLMIEHGDVLPSCMPRTRELRDEEVDELVWRVYCLTTAMGLTFVRCHPTVVRLAGEWWDADPETQRAWEAFCVAHWT